MPKLTIEEELSKFSELWTCNRLCDFLRDVISLFELYDIQDEEDWIEKEVGPDDVKNVRMIRMIYLISRIAENHAGILARIKIEHKSLFKRLEKEAQNSN